MKTFRSFSSRLQLPTKPLTADSIVLGLSSLSQGIFLNMVKLGCILPAEAQAGQQGGDGANSLRKGSFTDLAGALHVLQWG